MSDDKPRLPYIRRWTEADGETCAPVPQEEADRLHAPRTLPGAETVYFTLVTDAPDLGVYVDHSTHEVALLLRQAAAWLDEDGGVSTVLSVGLLHPDGWGRIALALTAE